MKAALGAAAGLLVWGVHDTAASSPGAEYRFVRAPIVTYSGSGARARYSVFVRLAKVLPDGERVKSLAQVSFSVAVPGSSRFYGTTSPTFHAGSGRGTCLGNDGIGSGESLPMDLRNPAVGRAVQAVMRVSLPDRRFFTRRTVRIVGSSNGLSQSRAAARLGCRR